MLRKFNPEGVAAPPFYSHGVEASAAGRLLYRSGQVGVRADGSVGEGVAEQAAIAADNLKGVLAGAGMDTADIAKLTIYLTEEASLGAFAPGAASLLTNPPAAATLLVVKALAAPNLLIEIEAIAVR